MIRERRNKEKLTSYYNKFIDEGIIDPNVHPWVAESWRRCEARKLNHETMPAHGVRLSPQELERALEVHEDVVKYVDGLFEQNKQYFNSHNLSMLLVDEDGYVLKNYALPFFQRSIEDIQGMRVLEEDVGTSSICVARSHNVPFLMFGPEMWIRESHSGDACSAPIDVAGQGRYILSLFSLDQNDLPYDILLSLLMTMKYSVENFLTMLAYWKVCGLISEEIPASVYWVNPDGTLRYCNSNGKKRLEGRNRLDEVVHRVNVQSLDDMFAAVGYGGITPKSVILNLMNIYNKEVKTREAAQGAKSAKAFEQLKTEPKKKQVAPHGESSLEVHLAKCCNPVPGDEIIGYITRGRGVTVHRLDCPNIVNTDEPERLIEATWIKQTSGTFQVNIEIVSYDRTGLMADILAVLSDNKTSVSSANINVNDAGVATMRLGIQIKDLQQLEYIMTKIRRVKGVHSVERLKGRKGN